MCQLLNPTFSPPTLHWLLVAGGVEHINWRSYRGCPRGCRCRGVAAVTLLRSTLACNLLRTFASTRRYSNNPDKIEQRKFSSCTGISGYLESSAELSVESIKGQDAEKCRWVEQGYGFRNETINGFSWVTDCGIQLDSWGLESIGYLRVTLKFSLIGECQMQLGN